jgi:hypothetical protein
MITGCDGAGDFPADDDVIVMKKQGKKCDDCFRYSTSIL